MTHRTDLKGGENWFQCVKDAQTECHWEPCTAHSLNTIHGHASLCLSHIMQLISVQHIIHPTRGNTLRPVHEQKKKTTTTKTRCLVMTF